MSACAPTPAMVTVVSTWKVKSGVALFCFRDFGPWVEKGRSQPFGLLGSPDAEMERGQ